MTVPAPLQLRCVVFNSIKPAEKWSRSQRLRITAMPELSPQTPDEEDAEDAVGEAMDAQAVRLDGLGDAPVDRLRSMESEGLGRTRSLRSVSVTMLGVTRLHRGGDPTWNMQDHSLEAGRREPKALAACWCLRGFCWRSWTEFKSHKKRTRLAASVLLGGVAWLVAALFPDHLRLGGTEAIHAFMTGLAVYAAALTFLYLEIVRSCKKWRQKKLWKHASEHMDKSRLEAYGHLEEAGPQGSRLNLLEARTAAPSLERWPLSALNRGEIERSGGAEGKLKHKPKDTFRLFHKLVTHALSPRDMTVSTERHIQLLLPLLLRLDLTATALAARLEGCPQLLMHAHGYQRCARSSVSKRLHPVLGDAEEGEIGATMEWFKDSLGQVTSGQIQAGALLSPPDDLIVLDPLSRCDPAEWKLRSLEVLKTFDSGHGPCLGKLTLVRRAETAEDEEAQHERERVETVLLKPDDVRPDAGVMLMFEVFNYLWRHSHIPARRKPCALTFQIVPGDREFGFMEFMADSVPVRGCGDFDAELKGLSDGGREAFLRTLAGSLVAGQ